MSQMLDSAISTYVSTGCLWCDMMQIIKANNTALCKACEKWYNENIKAKAWELTEPERNENEISQETSSY